MPPSWSCRRPGGEAAEPGVAAAVARWTRAVAPVLAAAAAAAVVMAVGLAASADETFPPMPDSIRATPVPLDSAGLSLDRCAAAIEAAGLTGRYPERDVWRPLTRLFTGDVAVTLLDAEVPFVCATGPTTVDVSDPGSAVPIGAASLLLTTPSGVLAAVAPDGQTVDVAVPGDRSLGLGAARHFLRVGADPITDAGALAVAVGDASGLRPVGPPARLAAPALHVVDRSSVPADRSSGAADMLRRCLAAQPDAAVAARPWETAQVLAHRRGAQPSSLLVAVGPGAVGGCSLDPAEVTPLRVWWAGADAAGDRPFVWLPAPGGDLPDLDVGIAAGPVRPEVVRMEVVGGSGPRWHVGVVGATFATQLPDGLRRDPRELTVLAFDAENRLVYQGPAVG